MTSRSVLNGESARTTITAGSTTSREIGVMSTTLVLAACCTSGLVIQTLVKTPSTWASPLRSTM